MDDWLGMTREEEIKKQADIYTDNGGLSITNNIELVKKAFTRLILVAVLFFLPTFVNLIIKLFVDNPCEIKF